MIVGELSKDGLQLSDQAKDLRLGNQLAVDLDALPKGVKMRGSEQADLPTGAAVDTFQHGARGTLSVGTGDMDKTEFFLGVAGQAGEFVRVLETKFRAEQAQAIKEVNCRTIVHREVGSRWTFSSGNGGATEAGVPGKTQ